MPRPVTLFTGQWADLTLETVAKKAREFGFDGLELACWGDHFDVARALSEDGYCQARRDLLAKHGLNVFAISNHLVGQAVCDAIDERHKSIIPAARLGRRQSRRRPHARREGDAGHRRAPRPSSG